MKNKKMKLSILIILFLSPIIIYSQKCNNLKKLKTFKGITIGTKLPLSIINNSRSDRLGNGDKFYSLSKKRLNTQKLKIYDSFFWFLDVEFDNVFFNVTDDNELISIQLHNFYSYKDSVESSNDQIPTNFKNLMERSTELFGEEDDFKEQKEKETFMRNIFGEEHTFIWKCENLRYEVSLRDGSNGNVKSPYNNYTIKIINTIYEGKQRLKKITN